ncbi:MAG: glycosyltransferase family 61 protein [Pontimonas sp.]
MSANNRLANAKTDIDVLSEPDVIFNYIRLRFVDPRYSLSRSFKAVSKIFFNTHSMHCSDRSLIRAFQKNIANSVTESVNNSFYSLEKLGISFKSLLKIPSDTYWSDSERLELKREKLILVLGLMDLIHMREGVFRDKFQGVIGILKLSTNMPDVASALMLSGLSDVSIFLCDLFRFVRGDHYINLRVHKNTFRSCRVDSFFEVAPAFKLISRFDIVKNNCSPNWNLLVAQNDLIVAVSSYFASFIKNHGRSKDLMRSFVSTLSDPENQIELAAFQSCKLLIVSKLMAEDPDNPQLDRMNGLFSRFDHRLEMGRLLQPEEAGEMFELAPQLPYEPIGFSREPFGTEVVSTHWERPDPAVSLLHRRNSDSVSVVDVQNATVTPSFLVRTDAGDMVHPSFTNTPMDLWVDSPRNPYFVSDHKEVVWTSNNNVVSISLQAESFLNLKNVVVCSGMKYVNSYGHFIYNVLPKISALIDQGFCADQSWRFAIQGSPYQFQKELLERVGVSANSVIWAEGRSIRAETVRLVQDPAVGLFSYNLVDAMRARLHLGSTTIGEKRLYIGRSSRYRRQIANVDALTKQLTAYGFEIFYPELHSVDEQIRKINEAKVIVAEHGSALATLMLCDGGKTLIEIFTKISLRPTIMNNLGNQHFIIPTRVEGEAFRAEDSSYRIDIDRAVELIRRVVEGVFVT